MPHTGQDTSLYQGVSSGFCFFTSMSFLNPDPEKVLQHPCTCVSLVAGGSAAAAL